MEILDAIKTQSRDTFANLVEAYGDSVYRFCRSLTYSKEDAEDLFQETFLKAFEQLPKMKATGNPCGFLFSTCVYTWKSWKRKYARRNRIAPTEPLTETMTSGDGIEDGVLAQEETRMVRKLVADLPEKLKIPIILYYTVEMRVPEIATTLHIPVGTVKSRLFKARKRIEKGLEEIYYET